MRILMLSQFYPPVVGGEETMVAGLARALAGRGHHVAVATLALPGRPARELDEGVVVHRIRSSTSRLPVVYADGARPHVPPLPDPEAALALRRILHAERPDVVHGHNWLARSLVRGLGAARPPLVVTLHDYGRTCATRRLMRDGAPCDGPGVRRCAACAGDHYGRAKGALVAAACAAGRVAEGHAADLYIAVSEAVATRSGLGGLRHAVIPNFLPAGAAARAAAAPPLPADGPIVFVGDHVREKGVHVLLEAHARLGDAAPELVLVGRPGELAGRDLGSRVRAVGQVPHEEVAAWWDRAAIAVAPSVWPEPFGVVALEASAHGRPVIASRTGGLVDIVAEGESGLLVPPDDPAALASALRRLVDDPALRRRLGAGGMARARAFALEAVVPRIEDAYAGVLAA